jgi:hypothetical protein
MSKVATTLLLENGGLIGGYVPASKLIKMVQGIHLGHRVYEDSGKLDDQQCKELENEDTSNGLRTWFLVIARNDCGQCLCCISQWVYGADYRDR